MSATILNANSLIEYFYHWEKTSPNKTFLRQPKGDTWLSLSYAEAGQEIRKIVSALKTKGLQKGDHVGILSKNCYHWILADLAIMMGGYVSIPYYASLPKKQIADVLELSDLKLLFVGKLDSWGDKGEALPGDLPVIKFPHYKGNAEITVGEDWNEIISQHEASEENYIPAADDLWTIKFTSGTTGTPKGVMHLHQTPVRILEDEYKTNWLGSFNIQEIRSFSFLPLNHVAERVAVETTTLVRGGSISFAESLDTFLNNLKDTQPTIIFAVPRIWTKFYLGIINKFSQKRLDFLLKLPIISSVLKKKIREGLGLGSIELAGTGAAITPAFIKDFYKKLGIHLIEAYGMTEVCGSMTNSPALDSPQDSVGQAIPGGEVRIDPDTGEILMKSPYIMTGYYKNPEKTAEVLKDGWMHSGDRGTIDEQGFVRVVGRIKDAFKTSKGSYVTPNPMEEELLKNDDIEQVCVVGLGIPQPIALVNLSEIGAEKAKEECAGSLLDSLKQVNAPRANYEKISTIIVHKENWSEDNGLLTPTLKVKRGKVDEKFGRDYLGWHEAKEEVIWK